MKRFFTLEYWTDEEWFVGKLREIPGVFSQGETLADLKENISDAYRMLFASPWFPARHLRQSKERPESSCPPSPGNQRLPGAPDREAAWN